MKHLLAVSIVGAVLVLPGALEAQNYTVDWHTIGGGGGTSGGTNGSVTYAVTGTLGQAATASMSGGNYSVTSGFWSLLAIVQTAGSPVLTLNRSGTNAIVSWNSPASGFVLEQSSTLASNSWAVSPALLTTNGGTISATAPIIGGPQYFRLHNP